MLRSIQPLNQRVHSGINTAEKIARSKARDHPLIHDALAKLVRQNGFQPVTDRNLSQLFLRRDEQDNTVIMSLAPDAPIIAQRCGKSADFRTPKEATVTITI